MKATMEDIVAKLAPQAGFRKFAQPLQWPFDKKDILELLATIERLKSHFTLVLQNDMVYVAVEFLDRMTRLTAIIEHSPSSQMKRLAISVNSLTTWI